MSRRNLAQQRILLTGASSGIGWALAMELASRGCRLVVTARREERLAELSKTIRDTGGECHFLAGDICDRDFRLSLIEESQRQWGGFDCLVNCAGIGAMGPFLEADEERLRRVFEVNFFAPVEMIRLALPLLIRGEKPLIVNISSVLGHRAVPLKSEYCASKFAVHGFSDALRGELKGHGVDVLLVSPSTTDSEFFDVAIETRKGRDWKGRRAMSAERVAKVTARAMRMGKQEVILSAGGNALVWLDRLAPTWADYLIAKFAK